MDLYIHSLIRLHGVVLNSLSTGTTLPFEAMFSDPGYRLELWARELLFVTACRFHSAAYPASCPIDIGDKDAGWWQWSLIST
jgi:hypothetical protein